MKKTFFWLALVAILCAGCKPDVSSCFSSTVNGADAAFSSACAIEAATYLWDFGDGGTSIAPNPTHTYASSGTYTVTLQVEDKKGHGSTYTNNVTITTCPISCVHGQCVNNACACDAGYEGTDCSTPVNAKFSGTYACTETCTPSGPAGPFSVIVSPAGGSVLNVNFVGLWEVPSTAVTAVVSANGTDFTIARQSLNPSFDIECTSGSVTANGNTISLTYKVYAVGSSTVSDACTAVLTK